MKFVYEFIAIFIEPFIIIIGPAVVCFFIGLALYGILDARKKKAAKNKQELDKKLLTNDPA